MNDALFLNFNGKIFKADTALISADNRAFRYGDGFFETMKMIDGKIMLADLHFERLFASLETLLFEKQRQVTRENFLQEILLLAKKNNHYHLARIRLTLFRGNGGLYDEDNSVNYIIQTWELNGAVNLLNENGLVIDVFKDAKKSCDKFSNIKSNNYLPYAMAAMWAKQNKLNDALLLNNFDRIADATIANVFIIKDNTIKTPALFEGCISGVMRKYLLQCFKENNIVFEETQLSTEDVLNASEVFLTNAIFGIKWVKQIGEKSFENSKTRDYYEKFILPLYK